ncbi:helix-turn-helix domain-containing protein [Aestuariicoccus sp. MJ-SS9]|uniref:helix-turn-helix transcriptional regulator n=1 Tax=Aestuariicoccus sp. MJ-SS9 TaxID=3079855 RepID=UPI002912DC3C|nr:helix-turn-helix domain-containing protein [Aestuariicoccus sp. MJ-SS9]MDU8913433.1 helix-turn-helix domain-containing protein [Aestuariicoccus sp. MJ-SS9]
MVKIISERLLTREEVAQSYGISKRYLEACTYKGRGPRVVRLGRMVRYRPSDIDAWIEANTCAGDD